MAAASPGRAASSPWRELRIKKALYAMCLIPMTLPPLAVACGRASGHPDLFAFLPFVCIAVVLPALDLLTGRDPTEPQAVEREALEGDPYYRRLLLGSLPVQVALVFWGGAVFAHEPGLSWLGRTGWVLSMGLVGLINTQNVAHELVHKDDRIQRWAGYVMLALVCQGHGASGHIRGHHALAATTDDTSTARRGESVYAFILRCLLQNHRDAWSLEATRLRRRGSGPWTFRNPVLVGHLLSVAFAVVFLGTLGLPGLVYFLAVAFTNAVMLESVNYIEHYGLLRRRRPDGRWDRPSERDAWEADFLLSNVILLNQQRHAAHHLDPRAPYQVLGPSRGAPQAPLSYPGLIGLSFLPPLWRRIMDPRIDAFYRGVEREMR